MEKNFGTLSQTVEGLKKNGYNLDFNIRGECLVCDSTNMELSENDFEIDEVYRFEGESNPDDEAIVYAISSPRFGVKGVLVNAYGIYSDEKAGALVKKLRYNR